MRVVLSLCLFLSGLLRAAPEWPFPGGQPPSCHAATVLETARGTLLVSWFAGSAESAPDVCLYLSQRGTDGHWSEPRLLVKGRTAEGQPTATWNPVLYQAPDGTVFLSYRVGPYPAGWWGALLSSKDEGATWTDHGNLPPGLLGPIKNPPLLLSDGSFLSGSSVEVPGKGWWLQIERQRVAENSWEQVARSPAGPFNAIQPAFLRLSPTHLRLLARTQEGVVAASDSFDEGNTWAPLHALAVPGPNSGLAALSLSPRQHLLVYHFRAVHREQPDAPQPWEGRWPLTLYGSADGESWNRILDLETDPLTHGYAYPSLAPARDGGAHLVYTWNREKIAYRYLPSDLWSGLSPP